MEDRAELERQWLLAQRDGLKRALTGFGQEHLLAHFDDLDAARQKSLLEQIGLVDLASIKDLVERIDATREWRHAQVEPADVVRLPQTEAERTVWRQAREAGEAALRSGEIAALLVAGGQGTRLGFDGPKGAFEIGPVSGKSLFQIHAEKIRATSRRYGAPLPLLVMTSDENDRVTREFFRDRGYFGLKPDEVLFFKQGLMPSVDRQSGRLLLAEKDRLALSPDGHGGVIRALTSSGTLDRVEKMGVKRLFYFQVDNPLVRIADPVMIGHHVIQEAEFSLKVIRKVGPKERVGNVVRHAGRTIVIEYTDLPDELAHQTTETGELAIWAGNMGAHLFDVAFVRRIDEVDELPFHRAEKKVAHIGPSGEKVEPQEPNAYKFERFIFDAFPLAKKALPIECAREVEFEPVKNREGENSPATARQAMSNLFGSWLEAAGAAVPRDSAGNVATPIEIGPLFALDAEELREKLPADFRAEKPVLLDET